MERIRTWLSRVAEIALHDRREQRLLSEIEDHLDRLAEDLTREGLSDAEARLAARRQFGGVEQVRIRHREQRGLPALESLLQDMRFAVRVLVRDRGFALTAIVVLGLGLGVNNLFFTLFYAHKIRGVPVEDVDRVLFVSTFDDGANDRPVSIPEFEDLAQSQTSFSEIGAYVPDVVTIGDEDRPPDRADAAYVTAGTLELLGLSPSVGRVPDTAQDRPGGAPVVLLGSDVWRVRYAGDPQILGRTILIDGTPVTVVGVLPERAGFPATAGVWMPLGQWPGWTRNRSVRSLRVIGRLRDDVSEDAARTEIESIFGRFEAAYPETNRNVRGRVVPLNTRLLGSVDGWMPFIYAGIIVILVACANVANVMMARALHRALEMAIRSSLGASRWRLFGQLLIEAGVIAAAGALVGGGISIAGVRMVESGIPDGILPYWIDYTMDRGVFCALIGVSLATIVVFGVVPALQASRTDVNRILRDGGRGATAAPAMRMWTGAFLAIQLALAMILLASVAVAMTSRDSSLPTDRNIDTTSVMTAAVTLPATAYADPHRRLAFFERLDERLSARPEIVAHSRVTLLPGEGAVQRRLQIRGHEQPAGGPPSTVLTIEIAPDYLATLALGVLKGRDFTEADGNRGGAVAIVNERFAQVFLAGVEPLGVAIAVTSPNAASNAPEWATIVGVAPTIRQQGSGSSLAQQSPVVYLPIAASAPATSTLMVRQRVDPETAASILRTEAQAIDPNVALYRMRTLGRAVRDAQWNRHTSVVLANTVSFMSVLLAIVGLSAVTSQRVTLKTREIGLRMALGARSLQVAALILRGLRVPLLLGFVLGTVGAMAWDGAFSSGLAGVYVSAPRTLLKVAAFIVIFVVVACLVPLQRATQTNPLKALRHE